MKRRRRGTESAHLSFGSWDALSADQARVVGVCHPEWRGVRTAAYTFRTPVVETKDLAETGERLVSDMATVGVQLAVVHGFPPGTDDFLRAAANRDIATGCVVYSSPAQHGAERAEAHVLEVLVDLQREGVLHKLGMAKEGVAESLTALGHSCDFVPGRLPSVGDAATTPVGSGSHIGVFAEPFWRKNLASQLLAAALIEDSIAHVLALPDVPYLSALEVIEHGVVERSQFLALLASMTVNLYVTLSECLPFTPLESYLLGVPCLTSRTSALFRDDARLWDLTTVDQLDNPREIAAVATTLLANRDEAMARASDWMAQWDRTAAERWTAFTAG